MKFKGIKKAASESKHCQGDGYGLECHIWLRGDTVNAETLTANSWTQWKEGCVPDAEFYTHYPMNMKEIQKKLESILENKEIEGAEC